MRGIPAGLVFCLNGRTVDWSFGMGAAIDLRDDFDAASLRRVAQQSRDGAQSRRLLTLAAIYDGHRRSDAAGFAGVGLQIVRDWVLRFNADGPDGLLDRKAAGPPHKLSAEQRAALAGIVETGPGPGDPRCGALASLRPGPVAPGAVRRVVGTDDGRAGVAPDRLRQALGRARGHYAQDDDAVAAFKKTSLSA